MRAGAAIGAVIRAVTVGASLAFGAGCASNVALNDPCANPCAAMTCPEHMHCSASGSCAAQCEADFPAGPIK
ncbi:MAG TPA: hypothetical protein VHO06_08985 [Polyangia bacterium]|nr:hypothetical protein [Polyangia bacterium]